MIKLKGTLRLYHLSPYNLDGKVIFPSIPDNFFTENGYEDNVIRRVCFTEYIEGCLRGLSQNLTDRKYYVHIPLGNYDAYKPSIKEVPDVEVTGEIWICQPVLLQCVGRIRVIGDTGEEGIPFRYGNNMAELYDWEYEWIEKPLRKMNENFIIDEDDVYYNFDKFESGETNLCFITGHSGSGKSTLAEELSQKLDAEHIDLDDLLLIADRYSMIDLQKTNDMLYRYFSGIGQRFYKGYEWFKKQGLDYSEYEGVMFPEFMSFALDYANKHSNRRFIIEGVPLLDKGFKPSEFTDFAFCIKGKSMISSMKNRYNTPEAMENDFSWYIDCENQLKRFRQYFKKRI